MRRTVVIAVAACIALPAVAKAQYWVEFNPGTCKVGPPPACVAGHWHPVYLPSQISAKSAPSKQKSAVKKYSEVSTDLEYESFSLGSSGASENGKSVGARAMYLHSGSSGFGGGALATYDHSTMDLAGVSSPGTNTAVGHLFMMADLAKRLFSADAQLTNALTATAGVSASTIKSGESDAPSINTYGPFASVNYQRMAGAVTYGATLSYSVAKLSMSDGIATSGTQSAGAWAIGFNTGYAVTSNTQFNVDLYSLNAGPTVFGGGISHSFTETFGLSTGVRKVTGMENFSNMKFTLGTVFRTY